MSDSRLSAEYRGRIPLWNRLSYARRAQVRTAGFWSGVLVSLFLLLAPIYWMFTTSIRPLGEVRTRHPSLIPESITMDHYVNLWEATAFATWLTNSIIVALGVVIVNTILATLGGYGLARLDMPLKRVFARGVLFGYMFPAILLAIPMYILWFELGIINSYIGLILAQTALSLPFSLWLMWKFFQSIPYSLEESAHVAGASRFRAFVDIVLPMAKPGMIAIGIFGFAISWGDFTIAKIIMPDPENYVLTLGLETLAVGQQDHWGMLMAGSFIAMIPAFLFIYSLQKYLLRGFNVGSVG